MQPENQTTFAVTAQQFAEFRAACDAEPEEVPALRALLAATPPWDDEAARLRREAQGLRAEIAKTRQERRAWRQRAMTAERKLAALKSRDARRSTDCGGAALGTGRGNGDG